MPERGLRGLGALPLELFDEILCSIETIRDLASFVTTSRFVYRRFEDCKAFILFRVLRNELGPALADARFNYALWDDPERDPQVCRFPGDYRGMAGVYRELLLGDGANRFPTVAELNQLSCTLHTVNYLADVYAEARLRAFRAMSKRCPVPLRTAAAAPLSLTERRRVVRAFYRRQLVSYAMPLVFVQSLDPRSWPDDEVARISNTSQHQGWDLGLFGTLEPWEMEQVDEANLFITQLCLVLVRHGEKHETTVHMYEGAMFDRLFSYLECLVTYMRTHPSLADLALDVVSTPEWWKKGWRDIPYSGRYHSGLYDFDLPFPIVLCPLEPAWQRKRARILPDPSRQERETSPSAKMVFEGDDPDSIERAPFGWVDALAERYVDWFGQALDSIEWLPEDRRAPTEHVFLWRCAGFAIWDRRRVEALKKLNYFKMVVRTGFILGLQ
ncbi:hypothetical protein C8A03DRAFT_14318 [Achaetomium macrosporum]|uniref:F-box domain-containing protein n=1 Tax=Achaetomium macrosporum TaxID=79813 RepID=A0AAN7HC19_9PEZI|nr:hypothetical protein C8A03DRAFT_14318 [Achaetomium macrosporum]